MKPGASRHPSSDSIRSNVKTKGVSRAQVFLHPDNHQLTDLGTLLTPDSPATDLLLMLDGNGHVTSAYQIHPEAVKQPWTRPLLGKKLTAVMTTEVASKISDDFADCVGGEAPQYRERNISACVNGSSRSFRVRILSLPELSSGNHPAVLVWFGVEDTPREGKRSSVPPAQVHIIRKQEEERKRIARELHDSVCQELTGVKLDVRFVLQHLATSQDTTYERCLSALESVTGLIEETRRIAMNLTPSILDDLGLGAAIRRLVNEFSKRYGIRLRAQFAEVDRLFSRDDELHLYRILQEVFANIAKHARAENVEASIIRKESELEIAIHDDGVGWDGAVNSHSGGHLGLRDIQERVELLNGTVIFSSSARDGTAVKLRIPIPQTRPSNYGRQRSKTKPRKKRAWDFPART